MRHCRILPPAPARGGVRAWARGATEPATGSIGIWQKKSRIGGIRSGSCLRGVEGHGLAAAAASVAAASVAAASVAAAPVAAAPVAAARTGADPRGRVADCQATVAAAVYGACAVCVAVMVAATWACAAGGASIADPTVVWRATALVGGDSVGGVERVAALVVADDTSLGACLGDGCQ
jgi:hypothetical protein